MSDLRHPLEIEGAAARGPSCTNPNVGRMHVSRRRALSRSGGVIAVLTASLSVASCSGDAPVPEPTPLVYTFSFGTSAQTGQPTATVANTRNTTKAVARPIVESSSAS